MPFVLRPGMCRSSSRNRPMSRLDGRNLGRWGVCSPPRLAVAETMPVRRIVSGCDCRVWVDKEPLHYWPFSPHVGFPVPFLDEVQRVAICRDRLTLGRVSEIVSCSIDKFALSAKKRSAYTVSKQELMLQCSLGQHERTDCRYLEGTPGRLISIQS